MSKFKIRRSLGVRIMGMNSNIKIKLLAMLKKLSPPDADNYPITPGMTVRELLDRLGIPEEEAKLIFINGVKGDEDAILQGGERVAVFPPIGGG